MDLLAARVSPVHHIPAALQGQFSDCLQLALDRYNREPSDGNLFALLALPKLALRPPLVRGKYAAEHLVSGIKRRLELFKSGSLLQLWQELSDELKSRGGGQRASKRLRPSQAGVPETVVRRA